MNSGAPSPAASPAATLGENASANLQALLVQLQESQQRQAIAAREQLGRLAAGIEHTIAHTYGVFQVATPPRFMVLRDVQDLDGAKPAYTTTDFAEALHWVNQRVVDSVRHHPSPTTDFAASASPRSP